MTAGESRGAAWRLDILLPALYAQSYLHQDNQDLNDSGQIAFRYTLADGRSGIAVATPALLLLSAVSQKTHGGAGTFDINMPLSGPSGVEFRSGGGS